MLFRQLARSLWRNKRSYSACILLMAIGIAIYVSFHLLYNNLTTAMEEMYRNQRFGEAFATVSLMPTGVSDKIAAIDGVARAEATLVAEARMLKEGSTRYATLRLSSFDPGNAERLNDFVLVEGALPGREGILISDVFAQANDLSVGDSITLVLAGTRFSPEITGTVQSPEYIYSIPDSGQLMPDNKAFGFGYMPMNRLGSITGKAGYSTNLSLLMEPEYSFESLKPQLEDALRPYGLQTLYPRKDQPSHVMLDQELGSIGAMASSIPSLFILIAVIILYIMLKRMIEQERTQIGVLKAFGFSGKALLVHYIGYGAATGLAGGFSGILLGIGLTRAITPVYLAYFSLPAADMPPDPGYLLEGMLIALASGLFGAFTGACSVLRLTPSEAMRPPAPPPIRSDLIGSLPFLRYLLNSYGFMSLRNIARNQFRSMFVLFGIAVAFAITAFMTSFGGMFDALMLNQFTKVELYNLKISLASPTPYTSALEAAWALEGIRRAEAVLELPVELQNGHLKKNSSVTAIEEGSRLYQIYDSATGSTLPPPRLGLILSSSLAEDLQAGRGDLLTVTTPYTGENRMTLPVMAVVESNLGATAYIQLDGLWELLESPPVVSGILLSAEDPVFIKTSLLEADNVAAITDQQEAKQIYLDMLDTYAAMIYLLQLAGAGIAFAIITNTASISLSERKREYATMRVLGMHLSEIRQVISLEYWVLFLAAIAPGVLFTHLFKRAMANMIDNDIFSIPIQTDASSFFGAAALCALAVCLSNVSARRKIARFDMAQVLKERE